MDTQKVHTVVMTESQVRFAIDLCDYAKRVMDPETGDPALGGEDMKRLEILKRTLERPLGMHR